MRKALLTLAVLSLAATSAFADPADLSGGVLITHYVEALGYSSDAPALGWCGEYMANYQITDASEQVNRIDTQTYLASSWFIIAAWDEGKVWCGTEFGFGTYDPAIFAILDWSACYPADGGLEIPTSGWPGPDEGIAFVVTGATWDGNYLPVMRFGGYAYGYSGEGQIPLTVDPPTSFAGFSNCAAPPLPYDAFALGALGINMDGLAVAPPTAPRGACCIQLDCTILPESDCLAAGGDWLGPDVGCDPNPCTPPPPEGACCLPEPPGACQVMTIDDCHLIQGEWLGPDTTCDPNPCEVTPTNTTSWGAIKSMYR